MGHVSLDATNEQPGTNPPRLMAGLLLQPRAARMHGPQPRVRAPEHRVPHAALPRRVVCTRKRARATRDNPRGPRCSATRCLSVGAGTPRRALHVWRLVLPLELKADGSPRTAPAVPGQPSRNQIPPPPCNRFLRLWQPLCISATARRRGARRRSGADPRRAPTASSRISARRSRHAAPMTRALAALVASATALTAALVLAAKPSHVVFIVVDE